MRTAENAKLNMLRLQSFYEHIPLIRPELHELKNKTQPRTPIEKMNTGKLLFWIFVVAVAAIILGALLSNYSG